MKKLLAIILTLVTALPCITAFAENNEIKVYLDGEQIQFDTAPIIENERTLVPMRAIAEALGAEVDWKSPLVVMRVGDRKTIELVIDSNEMSIDAGTLGAEKIILDAPAKIVNERTLVPLRAVSEAFDCDVQWDGDTKTVTITSSEQIETTPMPDNTKNSAEGISARTLTENDMKQLKDRAEVIRYQYEQQNLPNYAFENSDKIYEKMNDLQNFEEEVFDEWDKTVAACAINIQMESDTTYNFDMDLQSQDGGYVLDEDNIKTMVEYYNDIIEKSGLTADNYIEGATCQESNKGTRIGIVIFKSADSMVQCKYLAIAASKDGNVRYFTAENDVMETDKWFFCEVTKDGRGTLTVFEKKDEVTDLETFCNAICYYFEGTK